ncbi:FAD-dependent oxidoreductase [Nocardioides aurantiacus]|uniref:ferredoxin--NADP(+) reductase n=1 Tax=Nocardioides aurantiacus TaxID=86796 RepID=A0A3N2CWH7_9ACTN|nr:FAD-dependent oxidoreductase [Nocardioides aurantiacus]ROR91891.1 ferredoxin--NADP+ reductase [Nocardioides aurantiacus]
MPYAITQSCCSDASCVSVCPVNCIHPTPDEPDFGTTEMLYVDPRACIDCGACADACPVDAIFPTESLLDGPDAAYVELNRAHYDDTTAPDDDDRGWSAPTFPVALEPHAARLRVAVVGTGPSASYTASALLTTSAEVTMLDRLPVAGGLVRFGVAPDHGSTRAVADRFATVFGNPRLEMCLGVEVGRDVTHAELLEHHDAVVYAVGAAADRTLGVPGEELPGSLPARRFVGWYNDQPEVPADLVELDLGSPARAVVVGNGNVALDVARLLLTDPEELAATPIARHALAALRRSTVREVVLVGRRGPHDAAYSLSELRPLLARDDLDVVVDGDAATLAAVADAEPGSKAAALQGLPVGRLDAAAPVGGRRRLVLRFGSVVERVDGPGRVASVRLTGGGEPVDLPTGLLLRSVGYRSEPVAGLPFDAGTHTVPHDAGRVVDPASGTPVAAAYVVGWVKRGPRGGIGSNRADASETVASLVADANAGRIGAGRGSARSFRRLLRSRR